ncbi:helix-turn-helix transcriptional regulator [Paenibacillus sp. MMS20-IR301]|uniref:helix-turn-helix domain-containing protein n=1 Tax=Paenibacillus sp. MMS20-IR301 TaxID=2895946 RepID=UPI0028EA0136|nr:helix-turn-helix transcriptional regulator [Paenibacillus sp. MMS20-IR301]WNS42595.1 helix-turn-helix transcriptional regulator [Paenibacillus sp. MMS20-IR301]
MIRDQLANYLSLHGMSINQFAIRSGINSGTLSRIINGHQPIAMSHLELITAGMGVSEDYFYSLYVDECFFHSAPTWRRLRPFIIRCAELGRMDCIERLVHNLLDNLTYVPLLFEVAEGLFRQGHFQAAAVLYENVSASEKYQYSERLATCQYRLFRIALGNDQNTNLRAATLFESYIPRLDEAEQLDALKDLANVYNSLHRWNKVDELASELHRIASIQYELQYSLHQNRKVYKQSSRPIYGYILYSYLLRSLVCEEQGDYAEALELVSKYADGSWIREQTDESRQTIAQFQEWAIANNYLYRILNGCHDVLAEYVEYISVRESEIFTGVFKIIQAANEYAWDIDDILEQFSDYLPFRTYSTILGDYNTQVTADHYAQFLIEFATYLLNHKRNEGIQAILQSLEYSIKINSEGKVIKCIDLFEQHRDKANNEQKQQYKNSISEGRSHYEKKRDIISSYV